MSWTNLTKNLATFANQVKNTFISFLLKEDSGYLLLETGDKIILDESGAYGLGSKNSATFSLQTKNIS